VSPEPYWVTAPLVGPLLQTELLSNVLEYRVTIETLEAEVPDFELITHPLVITMTQDCELDLDHKARNEGGSLHRLIRHVLFCELTDAEQMRQTEKSNGGIPSSRAWDAVKINQNERYHVLRPVPDEIAERQPAAAAAPAAVSVPERPQHLGWGRWWPLFRRRVPPSRPVVATPAHLPAAFRGTLGMDFRRVFTMPMPELLHRIAIGEAHRHCYLSATYRDGLSNRFYGYHMRVALPEREE